MRSDRQQEHPMLSTCPEAQAFAHLGNKKAVHNSIPEGNTTLDHNRPKSDFTRESTSALFSKQTVDHRVPEGNTILNHDRQESDSMRESLAVFSKQAVDHHISSGNTNLYHNRPESDFMRESTLALFSRADFDIFPANWHNLHR
jgi:hypothetical protein